MGGVAQQPTHRAVSVAAHRPPLVTDAHSRVCRRDAARPTATVAIAVLRARVITVVVIVYTPANLRERVWDGGGKGGRGGLFTRGA